MKKLFTIILLLATTTSSFGQLFSSRYFSGIYYNNNGEQHTGLISINDAPTSWIVSHPDNIIYFKAYKDTVIQKVKMSTLRGFIIRYGDSFCDTFAIVHNSKSVHVKYKNDMMEVLFNKGTMKLYDHALTRRGGVLLLLTPMYADNYYFYGDNPDNAVEMKNKDFKDVMSKMLADAPEIVEKINNGTYKMATMRSMLKEYYSTHHN